MGNALHWGNGMPYSHGGWRKGGCASCIGLAALLLIAAPPALAQPSNAPPRARDLKNTAYEFYKQGDYEAAAALFAKVQSRQNELSPLDRADLRKLIDRNNSALRGRREGGIQLRQASEALQQNNLDEANRLLKQATANQYLSATDNDKLSQMLDQVRIANRQSSPVGPRPKDGKPDYSTLMTQARDAMKTGDWDRADQLAIQAEKAYSGPPAWLQPWNDTPAKVRRDVLAARQAKPASPDADNRSSASPLAAVRRLFGRSDDPEPQNTKPEKQTPPKALASDKVPVTTVAQKKDDDAAPLSGIRNLIWPTKKQDGKENAPRAQAKPEQGAVLSPAALAQQGNNTSKKEGPQPDLNLSLNDLLSLPPGAPNPTNAKVDFERAPPPLPVAGAKEGGGVVPANLTGKKEVMTPPPELPTPPNLDGPELPPPADVNFPPLSAPQTPKEPVPVQPTPKQPTAKQPTAKQPANNKLPPPGSTAYQSKMTPSKRPPTAKASNELEKKTTLVARDLIRQGYAALKNNDISTARKLAQDAQSLRPDLTWDEPNPDRLLTDIRKAEVGPAASKNKTPEKTAQAKTDTKKADPRELLRQGRDALKKNQLDEALELCQQAELAKTGWWGLFEDSPSRLQNDIQSAVKHRDRADAEKKLAQARKLFDAGDLTKSREVAWEAQKLFGPTSYWEFRRDRPDYLIAEIDRKARVKGPGVLPPDPRDMPKAEVATLPNSPPTATQVLKQQAVALLNQAHELTLQGKLVEARELIVKANELHASFGPNEDSPTSMLIQLASKCDAQVTQLLHEAEASGSNGKNPARFQAAGKYLVDARRLSDAFGLDRKRIDDKAEWLNRVAAGMIVIPPPAVATKTEPKEPADPRLAEAQRNHEIGLELLAKARLELKNGNAHGARRMFETAFNPIYGVQQDALAGIRSVDIEDYNQSKLAAYRNAEAGIQNFKEKKYAMARRIFAELDPKLLSPEMYRLVREISALREMQPGDGATDIARNDKQPQVLPEMNPPGQRRITDGPDEDPVARGDIVDQFRALQDVRFQKMRDRGLTAQDQAMKLFQTKNVDKAVNVLEHYLEELAASQLSDEQVTLIRRQVESRLQQFKTLQAQYTMANERPKYTSLEHDEGAYQRKVEGLQQQVGDLMKQYRSFYDKKQFGEALVLAEKMRDLDPDNPAVTAAFRQAKYNIRYDEQAKISAQDEENTYKWGQPGNYGPYVDIMEPVHFDKETVLRNRNRKGFESLMPGAKTEIELAIERKLQEPVSVNFQNTPLEQVIDDLRRLGEVNINPDYKALTDEGISLKQPLHLTVENVALKSVLNMLLRQAGLTYVVKEGVVQLTTEKEAKGKIITQTYSVADLVVPVEDYPLPSVYSYQDYMERQIQSQTRPGMLPTPYMDPYSMQNGSPVSSQQHMNNMGGMGGMQGNNLANAQANKGGRLPSNTMDEQLIDLITKTIAPNTWDAVGGPGHIQYYPLGMALVVNQVQDVQEQVFELLRALRKLQDLQVAIEMRLVSVSESFFEMMGMDFDVNFITNNHKFDSQLLTGQFQAPGLIQSFTPAQFITGLTPAGTFTPDLNIPINNTSFGFSFPTFGGYPGLGNSGGLDLGLAFLSDIQVFMFLEAAQGDRRMNVMQAPKITVFNGQTAFITVQDQLFFLTGMNPVQTPQGPVFVALHQAMPVGTQMQVTPVVSADRRFVRLAINQQMTNLVSASVPVLPVQIALPTIFVNGSGATPEPNRVVQMFFQQPTAAVIAIQTTVNVPDGGTVLLGGLKWMAESRNESGPPILSKIPYVNRLFKNVGFGRDGATLMLMVTPRIIINEEEELIFRGELQPIPRP